LKAHVEEERPSNREKLINVIMAILEKLPMTIMNSAVNSIPRTIETLCGKDGE
jgi:hypothetical protein